MAEAPPGGAYGYEIVSDLQLARLRPGAVGRGRVLVRQTGEELPHGLDEIVRATRRTSKSEPPFAFARANSSLITWCSISGSARIDPETLTITAHIQGDADSWEDRLLNGLIPMLLVDRGELILHAAAVRSGAGAIVVCGPSGRGKSTLAAVLGAQGMPVLAEDAVALTLDDDRVRLWPGPTGVRLDAATAEALGERSATRVRGKQLHGQPQSPNDADAVSVAAVIVLEARGGSEARRSSLARADALVEVFPNVVRLEREAWPGAFSRAARLVSQVPCHRVRLPDDLASLAGSARRMIADVTRRADPWLAA